MHGPAGLSITRSSPIAITPEKVIALGRFSDRIVAEREIPPRSASFVPIPDSVHPALREALHTSGFEQLYCHQAEMFEHEQAGRNVVITTGTASGKSLAFLLPVLQRIIENPASRAFLLFPTKALAQDQLRHILEILDGLGALSVEAGVYDGDTPPDERRRIRERANLILTNPDMLNASWLPNHGGRGFSHVFRNVTHVVLDEMHTYRGAFGAHVANLMRRFRRVAAHYGSRPRFLCSSATIANPIELATEICEGEFSLVDVDGSPSAGKKIWFWQPPVIDGDMRRGVVQEMSDLLPDLISQRQRVIAFCRSRKETEVVLKEARDALSDVDGGHDDSKLLAGYRGGYTPVERRRIQDDLVEGRLIGVVSTNALELGVDIGELEVVVQAGFPGTRASFWQQIGRAGRRASLAHAVIMLRMAPMDQYIAADPDWILRERAEHAVIDRDNLMIQLAHVRAAASELPLTLDDAATFPALGEIVPILMDAREVRDIQGSFHWCGNAHPAGDFSLRNVDGDRFKIVDRSTGCTISEMDRPQTYHEAHPRAVYLHDGLQYLVEDLDLVGHVVTVVPVEQNYYTEPDVRVAIDVLRVQEEAPAGRRTARFGDVRVVDSTIGYKMLEFHNHQNLGYEVLPERLIIELDTEAVWVGVPEEVARVLGERAIDYLRGALHGVLTVARMRTMAEGSDLSGTTFHFTRDDDGVTETALILFDRHPGGLGFSVKAFEGIEEVLRGALKMIEGCACRKGCPACVGDFKLEKKLVLWSLRSFLAETPLPEGIAPPPPVTAGTAEPPPGPRLRWAELAERWTGVVKTLVERGVVGADFLVGVESARFEGGRLRLLVDSPGLADWASARAGRERILRTLSHAVDVPSNARVEIKVHAQTGLAARRTADKLRRRFDDLTEADECPSET